MAYSKKKYFVLSRETKTTCDFCLELTTCGCCTGCEINLCGRCLKKHKSKPLFGGKRHSTHDDVVMLKDDNAFVDKCELHQDKYIKYYCATCDLLCCNICQKSRHRNCEIDYIPDIAEQTQEKDAVEKHYNRICHLQVTLNNDTYANKRNLDGVLRTYNDAIGAIKKQRKYFNMVLDSLESKALDLAKQKRSQKIKELQSQKEKNSDLQTKVDNMKRDFDTKRKGGYSSQLFTAMKMTETDVIKLQHMAEKVINENKSVKLQYEPDPNIARIVEVKHFGKLKELTAQHGIQQAVGVKLPHPEYYETVQHRRQQTTQVELPHPKYSEPIQQRRQQTTQVELPHPEYSEPKKARVMYTYRYLSGDEDILSLQKGQIVTVPSKQEYDDWCWVETDSQCGFFPTSYLEIMQDDEEYLEPEAQNMYRAVQESAKP